MQTFLSIDILTLFVAVNLLIRKNSWWKIATASPCFFLQLIKVTGCFKVLLRRWAGDGLLRQKGGLSGLLFMDCKKLWTSFLKSALNHLCSQPLSHKHRKSRGWEILYAALYIFTRGEAYRSRSMGLCVCVCVCVIYPPEMFGSQLMLLLVKWV